MRKKKQEEIKGPNFKEFKNALEVLCKEKNIDENVVFDAIEPAITAAYKNNIKCQMLKLY